MSKLWLEKPNTHNGFCLVALLVPPTNKEGHLHVNESSVRVLLQLVNNSVQNVLHSSRLNGVVGCIQSAYTECLREGTT